MSGFSLSPSMVSMTSVEAPASRASVSLKAGLTMSSVKMVLTLCSLQKSMSSFIFFADGSPEAKTSSTLSWDSPISRQR